MNMVTCDRCNGSGHYSYNLIHGTVCFKCRGAKIIPSSKKTVISQKVSQAKPEAQIEKEEAATLDALRKIYKADSDFRSLYTTLKVTKDHPYFLSHLKEIVIKAAQQKKEGIDEYNDEFYDFNKDVDDSIQFLTSYHGV